jgi:hypothetical protein
VLLPGLDPELAGILLVHLVAAQLRAPQATGAALIGGIPEHLAMEMVANNLFRSNERPDVLLARTRMLWTSYGGQIDLHRLKQRARPLDLLREATGLDFEDIAALTIAYYGYIRAQQPGGLPGPPATGVSCSSRAARSGRSADVGGAQQAIAGSVMRVRECFR